MSDDANYMEGMPGHCHSICAVGIDRAGRMQAFNSAGRAGRMTMRSDWPAALGIAAPQFSEGFECGFGSDLAISGVIDGFPGQPLINDTSSSVQAIIRSRSGVIALY